VDNLHFYSPAVTTLRNIGEIFHCITTGQSSLRDTADWHVSVIAATVKSIGNCEPKATNELRYFAADLRPFWRHRTLQISIENKT